MLNISCSRVNTSLFMFIRLKHQQTMILGLHREERWILCCGQNRLDESLDLDLEASISISCARRGLCTFLIYVNKSSLRIFVIFFASLNDIIRLEK